jgi:hypothetical protein
MCDVRVDRNRSNDKPAAPFTKMSRRPQRLTTVFITLSADSGLRTSLEQELITVTTRTGACNTPELEVHWENPL